MKLIKTILGVFLLFVFLFPELLQADDEPIHPKIHFLKQVYQSLISPLSQNQTVEDKAKLHVREYFSTQTLFETSIQDFSTQLNSKQYQEFFKLFDQLITKKIESKSTVLAKKRLENNIYEFKEIDSASWMGIVNGKHKDKNYKIEIFFKTMGESWKAVDIVVNGAKLSRNYRGQFNRIFREEGYEGIKRRLEKKLN